MSIRVGLIGAGIMGAAHAADWRQHFAEACRLQNAAWLKSIDTGKPVGANASDGYCASRVAEKGVESLAAGRAVEIDHAKKPKLHSGH